MNELNLGNYNRFEVDHDPEEELAAKRDDFAQKYESERFYGRLRELNTYDVHSALELDEESDVAENITVVLQGITNRLSYDEQKARVGGLLINQVVKWLTDELRDEGKQEFDRIHGDVLSKSEVRRINLQRGSRNDKPTTDDNSDITDCGDIQGRK